MENNSTLEKVSAVCNRNAYLLRLVSQKDEEKNLVILKSFQKKVCHFLFHLFVIELSNIN